MYKKSPGSTQTDPVVTRQKGDGFNAKPDLLDLLGGEQLEGSGFEAEISEPDSEWRDPR
jgi:hypothetical protein